MFFLLQFGPNDVLPKILLDKHLASRVFTHRANTLGRLDELLQHISPRGDIDWKELGPFRIQWEGQMVAKIEHIGGEVVDVPADALFSRAAEIKHVHLDCGAVVVGRIAELPLCNYFLPGTGPFKHALDSGGKILQEMAEKMLKQRDAQEGQVEKGVVTEDKGILPDAHAEKRLAALQKARLMLKNRQMANVVKLEEESVPASSDSKGIVVLASNNVSTETGG